MNLKLYWKDVFDKEYMLGVLSFEDQQYSFEINEDELKKAINHGCFGIGELSLFYNKQTSDTLFNFFKRRIPKPDDVNIEETLKEYDMIQYDEMELLEKTKGILNTDRYYLER